MEGDVRTVTAPRIVPRTDVAQLLGTGERVVSRVFGADELLLLEDAAKAGA